jgi:hypothetical protein
MNRARNYIHLKHTKYACIILMIIIQICTQNMQTKMHVYYLLNLFNFKMYTIH